MRINLEKKQNRNLDAPKPKVSIETAERVAQRLTSFTSRLIDVFAEGNSELMKRIGPGIKSWCRRGHRGDLDGISADLGIYVRGSLLVGSGAYVSWLVYQHHALMWPLAAGWCVGCLRARVTAHKKADDTAPSDSTVTTPVGAPVEHPVVALVRAEIGAKNAVHLKVLFPLMRERLEGLTDARSEDLKKVLTEHRITTRPKVRVGKVGGYPGVHRDDMPPLPSPTETPTPHPTHVPTGGDAGQSLAMGTRGDPWGHRGDIVGTGGGVVGVGGQTRRAVQDPDNPHRWHYIPD